MQDRPNRREFLKLAGKVALVVPAAMIAVAPTGSETRVYRFVSASHDGTSGDRLTGAMSRTLGIDERSVRRDWTLEETAFVVVSDLYPSEIMGRAATSGEWLRVEMSEHPLVLEEHRHKLGFHNYHRMRSGFSRIDVETFARHHPVQRGRKWKVISA